MGRYSLIALDMDGTLLNSEIKLSPGNREAIVRADRAGKQVVISTGRCLSEIRGTLKELPEIRYLVCENGSCVYDCKYGHTIHVDPIPTEEVKRILQLIRGERVVVQAFNENQSYFNRRDMDWLDACRVGVYRESFRTSAVFDEKLFRDFDARPFRVEKINLYCENAGDRARLRAALSQRPLKLVDSFAYILEAVSEHADKGRGLRMLCSHLGVPIEQTIAVGDSMNDIEILAAAGFSAAMGNACPEAKAAAHVVAPDCDHDGVAWVIDNYLLGEN